MKKKTLPVRKHFKFYKSYFDVYNELPAKDRLLFIDALFNKQFLGEDPKNLKGMSKFAYVSQKHSIDRQVKGFEDYYSLTTKELPPSIPPNIPPKKHTNI